MVCKIGGIADLKSSFRLNGNFYIDRWIVVMLGCCDNPCAIYAGFLAIK